MKSLLRIRCLMYSMTTAALIMLVVPAAWADDDDDTLEFEEAEVFFEFNSTDEDLGIHISVDGDAWKELEMQGPNGRELLEIDARSRLRLQGLTQLFIESAEPTFDELDPETFFGRFPPGEYEIEGTSLEGEEIESETELTNLLPAAPEARVIGMDGVPHDADEDCDIIDVSVVPPVTIEWDPVTMSFDDPRFPESEPITVFNYEVVVEAEIDVGGEDFLIKTSTILPPSETSYTVPDGFIALTDEWKFEVLAREASFNQTAIESCFATE